MSLGEAAAEIKSIGEESLTAGDVRIISGAYIATADQFIADVRTAVRNMTGDGLGKALNRWGAIIAKKTGLMRSTITSMFTFQVEKVTGGENFSIKFDRDMLDNPAYIKYHIVDWDLNPNFDASGYRMPTTPGTRPIKESEIIAILYEELVRQLQIEFITKGFSFTLKVRAGILF